MVKAWVGHFELPARDLERAATFYRRAFGWRIERVSWPGPEYRKMRIEAAAGDRPAAGAGLQGGMMEVTEAGFETVLLVLHVGEGDLAECLRRIVDAGGAVDLEPTAIGSMGTFARFRDSEGNLLGLWRAG